MTYWGRLRTYARLGTANIVSVALYKLVLKTGHHPVQRLKAPKARPPFYRAPETRENTPPANVGRNVDLWWFGWYRTAIPGRPPNWFANPFSHEKQPDANREWWRIPDFGAGDIKGLWELSRFDWVAAWSICAAQGDGAALNRLNAWLADWSSANPPYNGPNWKCGQEASIRVMNLVLAAWILGQARAPEVGLLTILRTHLKRIAPTISYAIGQQNNHGTSEAAALFIGGSFLRGHDPRAEDWAGLGRRWLEERAAALIEIDGSFSQYSVNYHRLVLDTYALCEAWRRHLELPAFSTRLRARLAAAAKWLWAMTDSATGDAPNIGANDGAWLLQIAGEDYRDFRPSVQLAAAVFCNVDAFGPGTWNRPLRWFDVDAGGHGEAPRSVSFDRGGYHVLRMGSAMAVLRYPRYRFRPSQADALHLDVWREGVNLMRDAGTFSYNTEGAAWFSSTAAHNTIEFDSRDQMPRIGRFLFADWLEADSVEQVHEADGTATAAAAYTDSQGARHHRSVNLTTSGLVCTDAISGTFHEARLRWRLAPDKWHIEGTTVCNENCSIAITVDGVPVVPIVGITKESRYYLHEEHIPEISVTVNRPVTLVTTIVF